MDGWTLFLDRDGVLNRRIPDGYVCSVDELEVLDGVADAVTLLSPRALRVVVVTNQAGVGKGLMSVAALDAIHEEMVQRLTARGGRIDAVLYCPHRAEDRCRCRKPEPGLAWQAVGRFPEIDLTRSVMVGDSVSDCEFAHRAGMRSVLIGERSWLGEPEPWLTAPDLASAAHHLVSLMST